MERTPVDQHSSVNQDLSVNIFLLLLLLLLLVVVVVTVGSSLLKLSKVKAEQ